jgi:aspartate/methionine/tyrosine aminotransferase
MIFHPFEMERLMSKWENVVEYNLSESGVHPVTLGELLEMTGIRDTLLGTEINYPQANGLVQLRERISALYTGSTPDNIIVTVGCIEANYLALQTLLEAGDEIALMMPNYMQIWGVAKNMGLTVTPFYLREETGWALDPDFTVSERTKLIAVCNPNNPTGYILSDQEMDAIVMAAERCGAWLLADEVYAGAERVRKEETPSFWGRYDKVLAMGSLSKAYGLPGLRIGWAVGPEKIIDDFWARHEYITISAGMLDNHLAAAALASDIRPKLIERARDYIRRGYPVLERWMEDQGGMFSAVAPEAAAIAFVRYHHDINSVELVERLMREKSVLVIPGDHFGLDHHLRISYGLPHDFLGEGLQRIGELFTEL